MAIDPKTIRGQIECLARLTGAPATFVEQVRSLFLTKGISLEDDSSPYAQALEEAFRREETIRRTASRARDSVSRLQHQFTRMGEAYRKQLRQLRSIRSTLGGARRAKPPAAKPGAAAPSAQTRLRKRYGVVTAPQRDTLKMVPGPKEPQ